MSGSVLLDLVLLVLLGLYAWSGWRQGFVSAVLGLVGLLGGAYLALRFAPTVLEDDLGLYRGTTVGVIALVAVVLTAAALGQTLFLLLARRVRESVQAPGARALDSVIHVRAESRACGTAQVGSGWVLSPGHVVTNAHVVAGSEDVRVSVRGTGRERDARVVAFDPDRDVAVLEVPGLEARRLTQGRPLDTGAPAVLAGFPGDDGLWVGGARVRGTLTAQGADIYGGTGVVREIYSLRSQVRRGATASGPVSTGACASG